MLGCLPQFAEVLPAETSGLAAAVADTFSVGLCEEDRLGTHMRLAKRLGPEHLVRFFAPLEPNLPLEEEILTNRIDAYRATGHPLHETALADWQLFMASSRGMR